MKPYCYGVDLGGTTVKIGRFSTGEAEPEKWEIPPRTEDGGSHILPDIAKAVLDNMKVNGIYHDMVEGIGIGVPGPVEDNGFVHGCANLGWGPMNAAGILSELTGLPVRAANDANAAALGEQRAGCGRNYQSLVMITLGTGVGGGVVLNGEIVSGTNGAAGEIGHMQVVDPADIVGHCGCGRVGCLEQAASATGLVNMTRKILETSGKASCLRSVDELSAKAILDAARDGDPLAQEAAEKMMHYLALAASLIASVVDPDAFVIGGGVSRAGAYLIDGIARHYKKIVFHAHRETPFIQAVLGNDAGMIGAAGLIWDGNK